MTSRRISVGLEPRPHCNAAEPGRRDLSTLLPRQRRIATSFRAWSRLPIYSQARLSGQTASVEGQPKHWRAFPPEPKEKRTLKRPLNSFSDLNHAVNDVAKQEKDRVPRPLLESQKRKPDRTSL